MIPDEIKKNVAKGGHWLGRDSSTLGFIKSLKQNFGRIQGLKVLDAGCAQGRDSAELASHGIGITGIDISSEFVLEARKDHPGLKFDVGSIEHLPYKDGQFDAVYCVNTLFYTDPRESLPELERVLRPGGIAFILVDERIIDLDNDKEIHTQDVDEALGNFKDCKILSKTYRERIDDSPFRHKHLMYEVVLKKS